MSEVRACLYFSVILLCFQISVAKPFFGTFLCDFLCDDDDDVSTTTTASSEDYFDSFCEDCPTRRPRPTTARMPPIPPNGWIPGMPGGPGMPVGPGIPVGPGMPGNPGPVNYFMIPPQSGANFSMAPNGNNGWWNMLVFSPANQAGPTGPPNATPAPAPAATTAARAATSAATTAAPTTAAPAAAGK